MLLFLLLASSFDNKVNSSFFLISFSFFFYIYILVVVCVAFLHPSKSEKIGLLKFLVWLGWLSAFHLMRSSTLLLMGERRGHHELVVRTSSSSRGVLRSGLVLMKWMWSSSMVRSSLREVEQKRGRRELVRRFWFVLLEIGKTSRITHLPSVTNCCSIFGGLKKIDNRNTGSSNPLQSPQLNTTEERPNLRLWEKLSIPRVLYNGIS